MKQTRFSELSELLDERLNEFARHDDEHGHGKAVAGTAVGAGVGYAALRKHKKTRTGVLRAEVKTENAIRGAVGKAQTAGRKGLKTAKDFPAKAGRNLKKAARLKRTQAGNLIHRGRQAAGLGYASPVSRVGRSAAKQAGKVLKKSKGVKDLLIAGTRRLRFESPEELKAYGDRLVALNARLEALDLDE